MRFKTLLSCLVFVAILVGACNKESKQTTLKDAFKYHFLIGMAMNTDQFTGRDIKSANIVKQQCNSITAENCMKSEVIQPTEGQFNFSLADSFVQFGVEHNMSIMGHTLIWHSQAPKWFFIDNEGNDVSRDVMIERMKKHIYTVVGRYKGKVLGWDVVNEAIMDDGSMRESKFYTIIGEDYIKLAFQFAHEADPDAELNYNDYNMHKEGKRDAVIEMVKKLKSQGVRIDGIGMQGHCGLVYSKLHEFETSLDAFSKTGLNVMITELDVSVLPLPTKNIGADVSTNFEYQQMMNPYAGNLPDSINQLHEKMYIDLFAMFLKYNTSISRVTLWGVTDVQSWKNDWPIKGRTDYPLLFDRNYNPKEVVGQIVKLAEN